ncbi:hypothetical protein CORC01_01978, partial [Colletotrichum orchidophilum]
CLAVCSLVCLLISLCSRERELRGLGFSRRRLRSPHGMGRNYNVRYTLPALLVGSKVRSAAWANPWILLFRSSLVLPLPRRLHLTPPQHEQWPGRPWVGGGMDISTSNQSASG